jgi:hypothetical protein
MPTSAINENISPHNQGLSVSREPGGLVVILLHHLAMDLSFYEIPTFFMLSTIISKASEQVDEN